MRVVVTFTRHPHTHKRQWPAPRDGPLALLPKGESLAGACATLVVDIEGNCEQ